MSLGPLYVFLGEVSVQVLCPFFHWVVCFPGVQLCEFFIYFGDQALPEVTLGNTFSHMVGSLFILMLFSLAMQKLFILFFKHIYWLCYYSCPISPHTPIHPAHPLPPTFPYYSSCPWVILISSLASTFPTLFLPFPCLFSTYHLCYLFSVPFPPLSPSHSPVDNPSCDLHFCGSVPVLELSLIHIWRCRRQV